MRYQKYNLKDLPARYDNLIKTKWRCVPGQYVSSSPMVPVELKYLRVLRRVVLWNMIKETDMNIEGEYDEFEWVIVDHDGIIFTIHCTDFFISRGNFKGESVLYKWEIGDEDFDLETILIDIML